MKISERKKRRAYLQDFEKDADGKYQYVGTLYSYSDDNAVSYKAFVARSALCAAAVACGVALEGTVRAPGTDNSPIVLLPYAVSLIAMLVFLWAAIGLLFAGRRVREYRYERYAEPLWRRAVILAVGEGIAAAGEIVFIALNGVGERLFAAIAYLALCALCAAAALYSGRSAGAVKWKRIARKSKLET